jgi:hypothetical protein
MTEQRKLCKDCLHYEKSWLGHLFGSNSFDRSYNPIVTGDLVTGDKKSETCKSSRDYQIYCGRDGRYFEQLWGDRK